MAATPDAEKSQVVQAETRPTFYPSVVEPIHLRELMKESIYIFSGQFAILCQFAHPGLAKGTHEHSSFAQRIPDRLRNTTVFLNAAVYGTPAEKEAICGLIHTFHARVKGEGYYADDPELHKWTAATVLVGYIVVYEIFFGKMERALMEALFKEAAVFATSLRMPPAMWPQTLEEFWEYWESNIATLEVTDTARKLARDLLYPKLPIWLMGGAPLARVFTVHVLPERLCREYGLEGEKARSVRMYKGMVKVIRVVYRGTPGPVRHVGMKLARWDMRRAAKKIQARGRW